MEPANNTLTITKVEGATRQTDAAIEAFMRGHFDIAMTLAGAAEGMLHSTSGLHMSSFLLDLVPKTEKTGWFAEINRQRDWLKHAAGPALEEWQAAQMIARAATKLEKWTPRMEEFKAWFMNEHETT